MNLIQELFNLNVTDYVVVGIILVSTLVSLMRGFFREFISLFIWIIGLWVAIKFYYVFAIILEPYIADVALCKVASFSGIFLLVLIFGMLFNYLFSFIVIKSGLGGADRLLGTIFGFTRGVLLVAVFLLVISTTSFVGEVWWKESALVPHFQFLIDWLKVFLPQKMTDIAGVMH